MMEDINQEREITKGNGENNIHKCIYIAHILFTAKQTKLSVVKD